jgi:hypothetical protein
LKANSWNRRVDSSNHGERNFQNKRAGLLAETSEARTKCRMSVAVVDTREKRVAWLEPMIVSGLGMVGAFVDERNPWHLIRIGKAKRKKTYIVGRRHIALPLSVVPDMAGRTYPDRTSQGLLLSIHGCEVRNTVVARRAPASIANNEVPPVHANTTRLGRMLVR